MNNPLPSLLGEPLLLAGGAFAAAAAFGLLLLSARLRRRRSEELVAPSLSSRHALAPPPGAGWARLALVPVLALGLGAALARPRWGARTERASAQGADVVLVLDTSASMRATDVSPSRFTLAREAALSLLERLGSDRVALVSCEGEAQTLVPLTLDTAAVGIFLDALEPGMGARPGTSLASGITTAASLFPAGSSSGRNCVLISDGEDLEGGLDEATSKARQDGMVVHTVLVGNPAGRGAPVPEVDPAGRVIGYKSDASGVAVLSRPNPDLMRQLAAATDGTFSIVSPGRTDLQALALEIDKSARRPLSEFLFTNLQERFQIPLAIAVGALGLLLLGVGRGPSPRRAKPEGEPIRDSLGRKETAAAVVLVAVAVTLGAHAQPQGPANSSSKAGASGAPGAAPASTAAVPLALAAPGSTSFGAPPGAGAPAGRSLSQSGVSSDAASGAGPAIGELLSQPSTSVPLYRKLISSGRAEAKAGEKALKENRLQEAVGHFGAEVAARPDDPTGAFNLGSALSRAGRSPEALQALSRARREGNRKLAADAAYNAGATLFRGKQYDQAAAAFRDALRLSPGDADAAWNYELCARKADEQRRQQPQKQEQNPGAGPTPTPSPRSSEPRGRLGRDEKDFEAKANMSREKADQILAAIQRADLEEQKKELAQRRSREHVVRDW